MFVRQHVEEPSDHGTKSEDQAEQTDDPVSHHACNHEGDPKREHHGPRRRRGKDDRVAFLPEPEAMEREFRRLSVLGTPSPKVWADAYLLAFTRVGGLKLVTFDRGLRAKGTDVLIL